MSKHFFLYFLTSFPSSSGAWRRVFFWPLFQRRGGFAKVPRSSRFPPPIFILFVLLFYIELRACPRRPSCFHSKASHNTQYPRLRLFSAFQHRTYVGAELKSFFLPFQSASGHTTFFLRSPSLFRVAPTGRPVQAGWPLFFFFFFFSERFFLSGGVFGDAHFFDGSRGTDVEGRDIDARMVFFSPL